MKILLLVSLFAGQIFAQDVEALILTIYTGDGSSTENAFRPLISDRFSMGWTDITSVERPDSVGLVVISATYEQADDAQIKADTTGLVLSRNPAQNNRGSFNSFLARKKNGIRLRDAIAGRPNVDVDDIILELKKIDREKKPRLKRQ